MTLADLLHFAALAFAVLAGYKITKAVDRGR